MSDYCCYIGFNNTQIRIFPNILNFWGCCGIINLLRGDEFTLTALMELPVPAVELAINVEDDYWREPFLSFLNDCLPFLSVQDLNLIAGDIRVCPFV